MSAIMLAALSSYFGPCASSGAFAVNTPPQPPQRKRWQSHCTAASGAWPKMRTIVDGSLISKSLPRAQHGQMPPACIVSCAPPPRAAAAGVGVRLRRDAAVPFRSRTVAGVGVACRIGRRLSVVDAIGVVLPAHRRTHVVGLLAVGPAEQALQSSEG